MSPVQIGQSDGQTIHITWKALFAAIGAMVAPIITIGYFMVQSSYSVGVGITEARNQQANLAAQFAQFSVDMRAEIGAMRTAVEGASADRNQLRLLIERNVGRIDAIWDNVVSLRETLRRMGG